MAASEHDPSAPRERIRDANDAVTLWSISTTGSRDHVSNIVSDRMTVTMFFPPRYCNRKYRVHQVIAAAVTRFHSSLFLFTPGSAVLQLRNYSRELNAAESEITLFAAAHFPLISFSTHFLVVTVAALMMTQYRGEREREGSLPRRSEYFSRCLIRYLKFSEKLYLCEYRLSNFFLEILWSLWFFFIITVAQ